MTVTLLLLAVAAVVLIAGPRLSTASWTQRAPRLAIFTWQALTVSAVLAVILAGVTLLIPVTALAGNLGAIVHACAVSVATAYGPSGLLPGKLVGAVLAGVLPVWLTVCAVRVLTGGWRDRRRIHRSLSLMAPPDDESGVVVLDVPIAAAFCVPGRGGRIVVTRGARDRLTATELEGVLTHETAHLQGRHSLAVALSQVLARAFPRVPLFQAATQETRKLIELLADDVAAQRVDRVSVASAIVRLAEMKAPSAALAMAPDAAALRVSRLLQPDQPIAPWHYRLGASGALVVVMVPLLAAGYPAFSAALSDLCSI